MAGTAREVVFKTLKAFAYKGIITLDRRHIVITNVKTPGDVAAPGERELYNI